MAGATDVYERGDQVGVAARFGTDEDPFDPAQVIFRVRDPEGRTAELTYGIDPAVHRTGPGSYQVIVTASIAGRWRYRFVGVGGMTRGEHEGYFDVFDLDIE